MILNTDTDTTVSLCAGGVYGFGLQFEYGYLISKTNRDALDYMLNGSDPKGPTRRGGTLYDVTAPDIYEDEEEDPQPVVDFGRDCDSAILVMQ